MDFALQEPLPNMPSPNQYNISIGLGCQKKTNGLHIAQVVTNLINQLESKAECIAVPDFKRHHYNVEKAAEILCLPLLYIPKEFLLTLQPKCLSFSERSYNLVGLGSVAEACALAAINSNGYLLGPRIINQGISCAFAERKGLQ